MTYENENPFGSYDTDGLTPQDLLGRLMALQSRLNSTLSDVTRTTDELDERQSQISQTVDDITLSVSNIQTTTDAHTEDISSLVLRADGIELTVGSLDTRIGAAETNISQNAGQIALKASVDYVDDSLAPIVTDIDGLDSRLSTAEASITVQATQISSKVSQTTYTNDQTTLTSRVSATESAIVQNANNIALKVSNTDYNGNTIASLINQTATTIKLAASKIDLTGYITATSLATAGSTTIDGGNVKTGTIQGVKFRTSDPSGPKYVQIENDELTSGGTGKFARLSSGTLLVSNSGVDNVTLDNDELTFANVGGSKTGGLNFNSTTGTLNVTSNSHLTISSPDTKVTGTIDFAGATVTGLNATVSFG